MNFFDRINNIATLNILFAYENFTHTFSDYYKKTKAVENGDYQIIIHGSDIEQNVVELLK